MIEAREEPDEQKPLSSQVARMAERLREARQTAGLSQQDACNIIGCTTRSLARWEHGECAPTFEAVHALTEAYGVSLDWLAGRTSIQQVLRPGQVLLDEDALAAVRKLAESGKRLEDLPDELVRKPGLHCAFVVPGRVLLLAGDVADLIESEMQQLVRKLEGKGR